MNRITQLLFLLIFSTHAWAQGLMLSKPHGFYTVPFSLAVTDTAGIVVDDATIRYTLDGSIPTAQSATYKTALRISKNTILRVAVIAGDTLVSDVTTATYLFLNDILKQPDLPNGYPSTWGKYSDISGTAPADYGMDPDMTGDTQLAKKIKEGFGSLPILSIVTDKDNLFSHENDPDKGGIYIFTGPPVGDNTGHGWTRPASIEMFGGEQLGLDGQGNGMPHDMSATCGLRLHGGHGRLAEKNPKHSFRLVFKKEYGKKTLHYPIFGEGEPDKFDQLVLRCHFGNSWQHWMESNRQKAQYTRDVWARRMQRKMGWTSVNALYVHLFLNGMYWGLYNIAERVDDQFGHDHLGGKKDSIDVIKVEEDGGNHLEAAQGDMEAWNLMVQTCKKAYDNATYNRLQGLTPEGERDTLIEPLLDIDAFIDYMLINQYGGNTDWDHHNWYAIRRRGPESEGYRFLCWDSELIVDNPKEDVLSKNNGSSYPTGIFQNLLKNEQFAMRYIKRAKEVLADNGPLGQTCAEELWDSLYLQISKALYDEAARWGDYRRDVHPYTTRGSLYTVDDTYMKERQRLHNQFFPVRSTSLLDKIKNLVPINEIDLLETPENWMAMSPSMFMHWDGSGSDAMPLNDKVNVDWCLKQNASGGTTIAGFVGVAPDTYADLTDYEKIVIRGAGGGLRILANRLVDHGSWKQITVNLKNSDSYWDSELQAIVVPLQDLCNKADSDGKNRTEDFLHLHAIKVDWSSNAEVRGIWLVPFEDEIDDNDNDDEIDGGDNDGDNDNEDTGDADDEGNEGEDIDVAINTVRNTTQTKIYRSLSGQLVTRPKSGIYILDGKKIVIR